MNVTKEETDIVISAIKQFLPSNVEIFFFGSRVDGTARKGSDLDVLLKNSSVIDLGLISLIREKLEDSNLTFKVDLLDYHACSKEMLRNIEGGVVRVG